MNLLPNEIIIYIVKKIDNINDLVNTKKLSKQYNSFVTNFLLKKILLQNKLANYKPYERIDIDYKRCMNENCWDDTIDIYEDIYYRHYPRYCHFVQSSFNKGFMTVNNKKYKVNTPYCCECFTNFVLIGDNINAKHNYKMNTINIDYINSKDYK